MSHAEGVPGSNMAGNLVLAGRVKDTIVLSNGENVEPQPIEDACSQSDYIQFIVLYGQDRRALGALICKNKEAFDELEKTEGTECLKLLLRQAMAFDMPHVNLMQLAATCMTKPSPWTCCRIWLTSIIQIRAQCMFKMHAHPTGECDGSERALQLQKWVVALIRVKNLASLC